MIDPVGQLAARIANEFGASGCQRLGAGAEACVFAISSDRVLKIYHSTEVSERLEVLEQFYSRLNSSSVEFRVPEIYVHGYRDKRAFSIEARLWGTPLSSRREFLRDTRLVDVYLDTATQIRDLVVNPPWTKSALFGDERHQNWHQYLRERLLKKRFELREAIPANLFAVMLQSIELLRAHFDRPYLKPVRLIHGDVHPGNVLIEQDGRATAVIDFGAFTMFGDPAYDTATACGYFSMYEPDQLETRHGLIERLLRRRDAPSPKVVGAYLMLAAVLTCDMYPDPSLSIEATGHFRWALSVLNDPLLGELIGGE